VEQIWFGQLIFGGAERGNLVKMVDRAARELLPETGLIFGRL